jgi:hypothetical protein
MGNKRVLTVGMARQRLALSSSPNRSPSRPRPASAGDIHPQRKPGTAPEVAVGAAPADGTGTASETDGSLGARVAPRLAPSGGSGGIRW